MVAVSLLSVLGYFPFEYIIGHFGKNWLVSWAYSLKSITSEEENLTLFGEMEAM